METKSNSLPANRVREIKKIILHCTATFLEQVVTVETIANWHKEKGWKACGYHYVIYQDGTIAEGRPVEEVGAHCVGHNAHSIGVCYVGGLDHKGRPFDSRTVEQKEALVSLLHSLKEQYPEATIHGHNEFSKKACPCFDVQEWLKEVEL